MIPGAVATMNGNMIKANVLAARKKLHNNHACIYIFISISGLLVYDRQAGAGGVKVNGVGPVFTVLVEQPMNTAHTSDNLQELVSPDDPLPASSINAFAHPNFKVPDSTIAKQMTAVGSAQVYFSRPRRSLFPNLVSPGKRELGSLFSPYWQARLVDTPCSTRHFTEVLYAPGVMPMPLPCLLH